MKRALALIALAPLLVGAAKPRLVPDVSSRSIQIVYSFNGAQYGARLATRLKPDLLRLALSVIILLVALRMAAGLAWRPDQMFSIEYL